MVDNRLFIGFTRCKIVEFLESTKCNKCHKFGHVALKCHSKEDTCSYYGTVGHRGTECPNKDKAPKCANCGGPFTARHAGSSARLQSIMRLARNTDFGAPKRSFQ